MKVRTCLEANLPLSSLASFRYLDGLALILDCHLCERQQRKIVFDQAGKASCTVGRHPFPARVIEQSRKLGKLEITIEHHHRPFRDPRVKDSCVPHPTRAIIPLRFQCLACRTEILGTIQNNLPHPHSVTCPTCGLELFSERTQEWPQWSTFDSRGRLLYHHQATVIELRILHDELPRAISFALEALTGKNSSQIVRQISEGQAVCRLAYYLCDDQRPFFQQLTNLIEQLDQQSIAFSVEDCGRLVKDRFRRKGLDESK